MKLYGNPLSPRFHRVAIAAAELGVPMEYVVLNLPKGDARAPDYLEKNAMGKVPTLEDDDGWTLWESCAIVVYLAETHPEAALAPADPRGRAEMLRWMFWCVSHFDPAVERMYRQKFLAPMRGLPPDLADIASAEKDLARFVPVLEAHLARQPWMLGESFGMTDIAIGASAHALFRPEVAYDRAGCTSVARWYERVAQRPSWSAGAFRT